MVDHYGETHEVSSWREFRRRLLDGLAPDDALIYAGTRVWRDWMTFVVTTADGRYKRLANNRGTVTYAGQVAEVLAFIEGDQPGQSPPAPKAPKSPQPRREKPVPPLKMPKIEWRIAYHGVYHLSGRHARPFMARIRSKEIGDIYLGYHATAEDAARAYDAYVIEHGLDRALNFPPERAS